MLLAPHDDAVSPVIATVLLIAITVIMGTSVFFFAGGFDAETVAPRSLSLASNGASLGYRATYVTTASSPSLLWSDILLQVGGVPLPYADLTQAESGWCLAVEYACVPQPASEVKAGDTIFIQKHELTGKRLAVIDIPANAVILTLTIR